MKTRDIVLIALFAALCVVLSLVPPVPVPLIPVPVTLQTLGIMLAGLMLGPWRGLLAVALYVLLAVVGLPVLPGGRGGMGVLMGPTGGFLLGMLPGAFVTGWLAQRLPASGATWRALGGQAVASLMGGVVVVYALGAPWLALVTGMGLGKAIAAVLVFIPGDIVKCVLAALAAVRVRRFWSADAAHGI
ncbi:biotin transporter BioY [Corticimicrobacter populi]|uniref:Biotin transporter n=1 Tax=Corticimicrobacter populi TaxID=2175229 RepID=A0A2V1K1R2_9BURK|nr:biotin transporter BioY [Corticimicrobacter populi]PWF25204.1 BioY family transporter [Corticimicrobacter populi]